MTALSPQSIRAKLHQDDASEDMAVFHRNLMDDLKALSVGVIEAALDTGVSYADLPAPSAIIIGCAEVLSDLIPGVSVPHLTALWEADKALVRGAQ